MLIKEKIRERGPMKGTVDPFTAGAAALASIRPPKKLTLSEWAEEYYRLSPENSSTPGRLRLTRFQRLLFDMFTDPDIDTIAVKKAARIGYTLGLQCLIGYHFHYDPAPMMFALPTKEDIVDFAADTIDPMRRDIREVGEIVPERIRGKRQKSTKLFGINGSSLTLASAQTPRAFRRITIRIAVGDEIDGVETDVRTRVEGDFLKLMERRTMTFWNSKIISGSTPKVKGASKIDDLYRAGTQHEYHIRCPHCEELFFLKWPDIRWDKDDNGKGLPETAHAVCPLNGCVIDESRKVWAVENGDFVRQNWNCPDGKVSVWINALVSPFPNARWPKLVQEFLEAKADVINLMPAFVNTILGEVWEVQGQRLDTEAMKELREFWEEEVPSDVVAIVCGVDIQGDRWEAHLMGITADESVYSLDYTIVSADPASAHFWKSLDDYLLQTFQHKYRGRARIDAACIDSGHETQRVYKFVKNKFRRRVYAIKGMAGQGKPIWPRKLTKTKTSANLAIIGVDNAKDMIYHKLTLRGDEAGRFFFPEDRVDDFFKQLTAEERIDEVDSQGFPKKTWQLKPGHVRNEVLDTTVYGWAALEALIMNKNLNLERERQRQERRANPDVARKALQERKEPRPLGTKRRAEPSQTKSEKTQKKVARRRGGLRRIG